MTVLTVLTGLAMTATIDEQQSTGERNKKGRTQLATGTQVDNQNPCVYVPSTHGVYMQNEEAEDIEDVGE